jgi:hypothetical protein
VAGLLALRREGALGAFRLWIAVLAFFVLAPAALYPIPRYLVPAACVLDTFAALGLAVRRGRREP